MFSGLSKLKAWIDSFGCEENIYGLCILSLCPLGDGSKPTRSCSWAGPVPKPGAGPRYFGRNGKSRSCEVLPVFSQCSVHSIIHLSALFSHSKSMCERNLPHLTFTLGEKKEKMTTSMKENSPTGMHTVFVGVTVHSSHSHTVFIGVTVATWNFAWGSLIVIYCVCVCMTKHYYYLP